MLPRTGPVWLILLALVASQQAFGVEDSKLPPPANKRIDFAREVEPIFKNRCQVCHGPQQQMNGLRLDRGLDALRGSYSGPVILPGDSAESKLVHMVAGVKEGMIMPPVGDRLTEKQIGILRAWIDQGAKWPLVQRTAAKAHAQHHRAGSTHWAFQYVRRPAVPRVVNRDWVKNSIDNFVLAKLEAESIKPSPEADKRTLLRRVTLDLIGLPPTPEEVAHYLADGGSGSYERVVDRLLKSPHYGERWAVPWLDLARYSDSDGYEQDWPRPHAWRYRHWVIQALNNDMPFDQFTIEQIAGDLLPGGGTEKKVATGFHRNTLTNREGGVKLEQFRFEATVDRTNTVGTVWLGLTVGCAQCHDHKYDPITQRDYYRLFAFFNNIREVDIDAPLAGEMGPYLAALPTYREKRRRLLSEYKVLKLKRPWEEKMLIAAANPGRWTDWDQAYDVLPKYLDGGEEILRKHPEERTEKEQDALTDHFIVNYHRVISKPRRKELNFEELAEKLFIPRRGPRKDPPPWYPWLTQAQTIAESSTRRVTHIHIRGDWRNKGIEVDPGAPAPLPTMPNDQQPSRLTLARWLFSRDNPLTARVAVNRMWAQYFGTGLVKTSEDFGTRGERPSHPKLLDWLAIEFMERGWSMKQMHKLIVMSATYRQSSRERPELDSRDPNNTLLARQSRLRLPAELIRDSALSVSGLLYPKIGGKSVRPTQPEGVVKQGVSVFRWKESKGQDRYRRGLYIHLQRTAPYPQMVNFDVPDRYVTVCSRERSNTPLQSLNLLNDPVFVEAARALAIRILHGSHGSLRSRLKYAFQLSLARPPNSNEMESLRRYYQSQRQILEDEPESAERLMPIEVRGVSRGEAATWVGVASVLLNLDEFITRE